MSTTLAKQIERYAEALGAESWDRAIRETFQKKTLSHELLTQLVEECLSGCVDTKDTYIVFCQKFLALILLYRFSKYSFEQIATHLSPLYLKLIRNQFPKELQLATFYRALIAFLLGEERMSVSLHLMEGGIPFVEYGGHYSEDHLPHFIKNGELALLATILALVTHNDKLLQEALMVGLWHSTFLESGKMFPEGLWMKEKEFCVASLSFVNALLLEVTSSLLTSSLQIKKAYKTAYSLFEELTMEELSHLGSVYPLLYLFFLEVIESYPLPLLEIDVENFREVKQGSKLQESKLQGSRLLGFEFYEYKDFSCFCTASGAGSGFAALRKGSIHIVSIGPHFASLGDMHKYGIYRTPVIKQTPFKDVKIDKKDDMFSFEGWTRTIDEKSDTLRPGNSWLNIGLSVKENQCQLKVKWMNLKDSPDFFLAFFVQAQKIIVDKNYHLHPHTLDRYQGKAAEISLQSAGGCLNIKTNSCYSMQVIPLAGENHFWGARFLVAYSLPKDQEILFEII